jgi:VanZ family protein
VLRVLVRVAPAVVWAGVIFYLSAQPNLGTPSAIVALLRESGVPPETYELIDYLVRKAAHFTEYAILAVLIHHALGLVSGWSAQRRVAVAWALAVLYAASDEFHQSFVPGRGPAVTDVVIDACGALAGLLLWRILARWWAARRMPADLAHSQSR